MVLSALQHAPSPLAPLSLGTVVGSFVLQRVIAQDDFHFCYGATAPGVPGEMTVEEYAPEAIAQRQGDGSLQPCSPVYADLWTEGLQAFARESMRFEQVGHGSLQPLGAVWQARGTGYRLCAAVAGRTLATTLSAMTEPPSEAWLRRLVTPLLDALEALHGSGGLHGNVQPDSIVIQAHGPAVLIAPGAVRLAIGARLPGPPVWPHAAFTAPELLNPEFGAPVGPWSDLYALAATVRWCAAGAVPMGVALDNLAALPSARGWSTGFVSAISQALARDPARRPQSVAEFRREFDMSPAWPPAVAEPGGGIQRMTANSTVRPLRADTADPAAARPRRHVKEPTFAPARDPLGPTALRPGAATPRVAASVAAVPRGRWPAALAGAAAGAVLAIGALQGPWAYERWRPALTEWVSMRSAQAGVPAALGAVGLKDAGVVLALPQAASSPPAEPVTPLVAPPFATPGPAPDDPPPGPAPVEPVPETAAIDDRVAAAEPPPAPAAAAKPVRAKSRASRAAAGATGPAAACGSRTNFARYLCVKTQCETPRWYAHRQCVAFRTAEQLP